MTIGKLKGTLLILSAVAGAVPGIAYLQASDLVQIPVARAVELDRYINFAVVVASSLGVLTAYVFRDWFQDIDRIGVAILIVFGVITLVYLSAWQIGVTNEVQAVYHGPDGPERVFVPLILPDSVKVQIENVGSRSRYVATYGRDSFTNWVTEERITQTTYCLLIPYSGLAFALAALFGGLILSLRI